MTIYVTETTTPDMIATSIRVTGTPTIGTICVIVFFQRNHMPRITNRPNKFCGLLNTHTHRNHPILLLHHQPILKSSFRTPRDTNRQNDSFLAHEHTHASSLLSSTKSKIIFPCATLLSTHKHLHHHHHHHQILKQSFHAQYGTNCPYKIFKFLGTPKHPLFCHKDCNRQHAFLSHKTFRHELISFTEVPA